MHLKRDAIEMAVSRGPVAILRDIHFALMLDTPATLISSTFL